MKMRDSMRSVNKRGPRSDRELTDFKVHKNLLAAQSDDEGSTVDARVYTVPPKWVTLVTDMNSDISSIKIKRALYPSRYVLAGYTCLLRSAATAHAPLCSRATAVGRAGGRADAISSL